MLADPSQVVPDESSSFESRAIEERDTINQNHMNMCRFQSCEDEGYQKFSGALKGFLGALAAEKEQSTNVAQAGNEASPQGS